MEMFQVFFIESMIFYSVHKRVLSLEGNLLYNGAKSNDDAFILEIAIFDKVGQLYRCKSADLEATKLSTDLSTRIIIITAYHPENLS